MELYSQLMDRFLSTTIGDFFNIPDFILLFLYKRPKLQLSLIVNYLTKLRAEREGMVCESLLKIKLYKIK